MKSLCVKENCQDILNFVNNRLLDLDLDSVYVTNSEFKIYKNVIIHCTKDENTEMFYDKLSSILTDTIIKFYQKNY